MEKNQSKNYIEHETWYKHFKDLLNKENSHAAIDNISLNLNFIPAHSCDDLNKSITNDEIIRNIRSLKDNKSPGPDGICAELYKYVLHEILPFLNKLFNEIFDSSNIPEEWCKSIITPIHKKGSFEDPNNYRGISLLNCISKVFMSILTKRLTNWCNENCIIDQAQSGFRKDFSTIDSIFVLMSLTQKYLSKRTGRFYCIFIDFEKAFDSIRHDKLWDALRRKGVSGKFLSTFQSLYGQLKSCVKVDDTLTEYFRCTVGTRQGCVASPQIFSIFINDLINYVNQSSGRGIFVSNAIRELNCLLFADDVSSFSDTIIQLQRQIDYISEFSRSVGLNINAGKTKIVVFRNGGIIKQSKKWFCNNKEIEIVPVYKYLGLYLTSNLSWNTTIDMLSRQAFKAIGIMCRIRRNFGFLEPVDMFKIFDSAVKPILCYGSQIWGYKYIDKIERVHIKYCKIVGNLAHKTCDAMALGECGRLPISLTYMKLCMKYWLTLLRMDTNRYPKQCYEMLRRLDTTGRHTWATNIKDLLFRYGFGYAWVAQEVGNENIFLSLFCQRVKDIFTQKWFSDIDSTPKAHHYKYFKSNLAPEYYLSLDISYVYKKMLSNFRCSNHDLMIEKGRHLGIDRQLRICPLCKQKKKKKKNLNIIEDEFHFFFECMEYENLGLHYCNENWLRN